MLTREIRKYIDSSVLCWLATVGEDGRPNVSPKEVFSAHGDSHIVIANIASPQSIRNLQSNPNACVSFVDIFVQKGFKLRGLAEALEAKDLRFPELVTPLLAITKGVFPIHSVILLQVEEAEAIIAPAYRFVPGTTEKSQVRVAMETYNVEKIRLDSER